MDVKVLIEDYHAEMHIVWVKKSFGGAGPSSLIWDAYLRTSYRCGHVASEVAWWACNYHMILEDLCRSDWPS